MNDYTHFLFSDNTHMSYLPPLSGFLLAYRCSLANTSGRAGTVAGGGM